jgi:hypothetical protein
MKQWNSDNVESAIISVPECQVIAQAQPEDYTTETFYVNVCGSEHSLWIRGFRTDSVQPLSDDNQIEMVEVTTGYSDGDMPNDPVLCIVHAKVKAALMTEGYQVVNSMDPYF